jgi:hypothetical protein
MINLCKSTNIKKCWIFLRKLSIQRSFTLGTHLTCIRSSVSRSTAEVASSRTRILVFLRQALARQISWRWPTLRSLPPSETEWSRPHGNNWTNSSWISETWFTITIEQIHPKFWKIILQQRLNKFILNLGNFAYINNWTNHPKFWKIILR